jgi:hypothetical protein
MPSAYSTIPSTTSQNDNLGPYRQYVVKEVISDPLLFVTTDPTGKNGLQNKLSSYGINAELVAEVCINSIIAVPARFNNEDTLGSQAILLHPFFPPHLTLPIQRGETIWGIQSSIVKSNRNIPMGYWFCRVVAPYYTDDVNFTHLPRKYDARSNRYQNDTGEKTKKTGENPRTQLSYDFINGAVDYDGNHIPHKFHIENTGGNATDEIKNLVLTGDHSNVTMRAAVPQIKVRPGDVALSGINNSMVRIGSDMSKDILDTSKKDKIAGAIDIVAGRGQLDTKSFAKTQNTLNFSEILKPKENFLDKESKQYYNDIHNMDMILDKSRIYIAESTAADANFGLQNFNKNIKNLAGDLIGTDSEPTIVQKSDKLRIVARKNAQIVIVGNDDAKNSENNYVTISVNSTGEVYIKTPKMVRIDAQNVYLGNDAENGQAIPLGNKLIEWLQYHTHPVAGPQSAPPNPVAGAGKLSIKNLLSKHHKISDEKP